MSKTGNGHARALAGLVRLLAEGTRGVADLAEAVHLPIARATSRIGGPVVHAPVVGVTRLAYRGVRGAAGLAQAGVDALLARTQGLPAGERSGAADVDLGSLDAVRAALNGVLGDHLEATGNPLAIPMQLVIAASQAAPMSAHASATRLLVLVHGLCMSDRLWLRSGLGEAAGDDPHRPRLDHDHGAFLAAASGWTPVYLRYNTGLHIAGNGRGFADAMERLVCTHPTPVERIAIVGHSMGGLVARSAVDHAARTGQTWIRQLDRLVFLGTPHHGAPLERWGHHFEQALAAIAPLRPFARLGRVRSAGITDLRHGRVRDDDGDPAAHRATAHDRRAPLPLPARVSCHAIAASLARAPTGQGALAILDAPASVPPRTRGDGLVPVASALGRHRDARHQLAFPPGHLAMAWGVGHIGLLGSPAVAEQLRRWIG